MNGCISVRQSTRVEVALIKFIDAKGVTRLREMVCGMHKKRKQERCSSLGQQSAF
jgi:hypothetical protein